MKTKIHSKAVWQDFVDGMIADSGGFETTLIQVSQQAVDGISEEDGLSEEAFYAVIGELLKVVIRSCHRNWGLDSLPSSEADSGDKSGGQDE